MRMKNAQSIAERAAELLDMPAEAVANVPRIELTGTGSVYIEKHGGIIEYGTEEIVLGCGRGAARVRGAGLRLKAMNADELLITGRISGLEFEF